VKQGLIERRTGRKLKRKFLLDDVVSPQRRRRADARAAHGKSRLP
jgi:hypothetical protein